MRKTVLVTCLLLSGCNASAAESTFMGREKAHTMTFHGAPWLTRESREAEERPDLLHAALRLRPGDNACDIGAGNGYHTLPMARSVAPGGTAYAVDIQPEMLELLRLRTESEKVGNVARVLNSQGQSGLPAATCDVALMVDVYHEFSDPSAMLKSLRVALEPDGELVVVEYREEDPSVPIKPRHKMSKAQVHKELTAHGFKLVRELDTLPWQHAMFYQRSDGPGAELRPKPWKPSP
jgi:ubiquinone/menaquinone biosynthesis C-methylase UbiE